jgi:hypothetical protein
MSNTNTVRVYVVYHDYGSPADFGGGGFTWSRDFAEVTERREALEKCGDSELHVYQFLVDVEDGTNEHISQQIETRLLELRKRHRPIHKPA